MRAGYFWGVALLGALAACGPSQPADPQAKLAEAQAQHQSDLESAGLREGVSGAPAGSKEAEPEKKAAMVTLREGETPPAWNLETPRDCETEFWCGMAFVDDCANLNSCRALAETRARDDLRKRIAVRIRSLTVGRLYREQDMEGESGNRQFEQEIREKGATIELKNVRFEHFFWIPERQHMVLARMERPKVEETPDAKANKSVGADWHPVRLVVAEAAKPAGLHQDLREHLAVLLREQGASVEDDTTHAESFRILAPSLKVQIDEYSGQFQLFKGMATVYLTLTVQDESGKPVARKTWTAKRLLSKPPDDLTTAEQQEAAQKTLRKGLREFEAELLGFLGKHLQL
jgi:hypothetical protein